MQYLIFVLTLCKGQSHTSPTAYSPFCSFCLIKLHFRPAESGVQTSKSSPDIFIITLCLFAHFAREVKNICKKKIGLHVISSVGAHDYRQEFKWFGDWILCAYKIHLLQKIQLAVISNSSRICDCLLIKRALIHICLSPIA